MSPKVGMRLVHIETGATGTVDAVDDNLRFVVKRDRGGWFGWTSFADKVWFPL